MQAKLAIHPNGGVQVQVGADQAPEEREGVGLGAADPEARGVDRVEPDARLAAEREIGVLAQRDVAQRVETGQVRRGLQVAVVLVGPDQLERRRLGGLGGAGREQGRRENRRPHASTGRGARA